MSAAIGERVAPSAPPLSEEPPGSLILIQPSRGLGSLRLRELWDYRELLFFLVWRDLKVRYKQTALGAAWAVLQPFLTMVVFSIFFGRLAGIPSDGVPYPIFAYCALLPWTFFANAIGQSGNSLVTNAHLISKVYFPRLVIPLAPIGAGVVDLAVAFVVLLGMMVFYGIVPTVAIVALPLLVVLAMVTALSVSLWLSALNVRYRDVRHALPFLAQVWLFATPVAYPSSLVPEQWRVVYGLNPMVAVVDGFRWALLGTAPPPASMVGASAAVVLVLLIGGVVYFRRMERSFADII